MIAFIKGTLHEKTGAAAVVEAGGLGYEVHLTPAALSRLPGPGGAVELLISETTALYGGGTTLYGFATREEKEIFHALRDHVPSTGAKKALEYLDKASRSLGDFRRAVMEADARMLAEVFGFSRKTAEKLIAGLKDKVGEVAVSAGGRLEPRAASPEGGAMAQALDALAALGYRPAEARAALQSVAAETAGRARSVEDILRLALKRL